MDTSGCGGNKAVYERTEQWYRGKRRFHVALSRPKRSIEDELVDETAQVMLDR